MSENIAFFWHNAADNAALTASTEVATMPASNLQKQQKNKIWRSTANTATIDFVLDAAEDIRVAAALIYGHNLTPTGTIQLQIWTDAIAGASLVVDETISPWADWYGYGYGGYGVGGYGGAPGADIRALFPAVSVIYLPNYLDPAVNRYCRFTLTDTSLSYLQASRAYIGDLWQPETNFDWGSDLAMLQGVSPRLSPGRQEFVNPITDQREFAATLSWLTPEERDTLALSRMSHGLHKPFFVIPRHVTNAEQIMYSMYARYTNVAVKSTRPGYSAARVGFREVK